MQKWSCRLSVAQVGSVGLQSSFVRHAKNISLIFQDTAKIGLLIVIQKAITLLKSLTYVNFSG